MANDKNTPGKTGEFPEGKLHWSDEGGLTFTVGIKDGAVVLDFGTPVVWFGMQAQQAADLGSLLIRNARRAAREAGNPDERQAMTDPTHGPIEPEQYDHMNAIARA